MKTGDLVEHIQWVNRPLYGIILELPDNNHQSFGFNYRRDKIKVFCADGYYYHMWLTKHVRVINYEDR